jgi:hypothetical protein
MLALLLEEYGVTFEYLPGKKQKNVATVPGPYHVFTFIA